MELGTTGRNERTDPKVGDVWEKHTSSGLFVRRVAYVSVAYVRGDGELRYQDLNRQIVATTVKQFVRWASGAELVQSAR